MNPTSSSGAAVGKLLDEWSIAATKSKDAVAFRVILGLLLATKGRCTDQAVVSGVKAFDAADDPRTLIDRHLLPVEIIGEAEVGTSEMFEIVKKRGGVFTLLVCFRAVPEGVVVKAKLRAITLVERQTSLFDERP